MHSRELHCKRRDAKSRIKTKKRDSYHHFIPKNTAQILRGKLVKHTAGPKELEFHLALQISVSAAVNTRT